MDGFTFDECMFDVRRHGWIDGFMNGWINRWKDE